MRPQILHRRHLPALRSIVLRGGPWKLGFAILGAALLMARGTAQPAVHLQQQTLAVTGGPTEVPCLLPAGETRWTAAGSPYILPSTIPSDPSACAPFPPAAESEPLSPPGVVVGHNSTLVIDGSAGPVQIFSHGAGIYVAGGELQTIGTGADNSVTFDAEPDVASWTASGSLPTRAGRATRRCPTSASSMR